MSNLFGFVPVRLITVGAGSNFIGGLLALPENYCNPIRSLRNQVLPSNSFTLGQFPVCVIQARNIAPNVFLCELNRRNCIGKPGRTVIAQQAQHSQFFGGNYEFFNAEQFLSLGACYRLMHRAWSCKRQMGTKCAQFLRERFKARGKACRDDVRPKQFALPAKTFLAQRDSQGCKGGGNSGHGGNCAPNCGPVFAVHVVESLFFVRILT